MSRRFFTLTRLVRRLIAVAVVCASAFFAFHLYIFGGEPWISALLALVAMLATAFAF